MAHWFHRNPLKATDIEKFDLKEIIHYEHSVGMRAYKICEDLRLRREKVIKHFESASCDLNTIEDEFKAYLSLLYGFIYEVDEKTHAKKNSKLRHLIKFTWTNSMLGPEAIESSDSWFEALSMCMNMAIWLMKHAAWVSAKDEVGENDAKTIHSCLRKAAGIFGYVLENKEKLGGLDVPGNDFDQKILYAYFNQCVAEAQEVTISRAIELKHKPTLICALATETASIYQQCDKCIEDFDSTIFNKWRHYFQLKHRIYLAYAYAYLGESLLADDKCGMAIRACTEGIRCHEIAVDLCAKYAKATGPGFIAKPEKHLFFRRIPPLLKRHLEKAERENSHIYHDRVPSECPPLSNNTSHGLAKPQSFTFPDMSEQWGVFTEMAFDITKAGMPDFTKPKSGKKLSAVKEEKIYATDKDPIGCTIF